MTLEASGNLASWVFQKARISQCCCAVGSSAIGALSGFVGGLVLVVFWRSEGVVAGASAPHIEQLYWPSGVLSEWEHMCLD